MHAENGSPIDSRWSFRSRIFDLLLILVLLAAVYLRASGLLWGEYNFLHPDERFLVWVGADISPVTCADPALPLAACPPDQIHWLSFSEYFDTARSTLNPNNYPTFGFYVYGTLPMFLARYVVQWIFGHSGWVEMTQVGRSLSALADLLTVLLVYMTGSKLYDKRVGILAAAFSAAAVLQIQQSHFFTMDTFVTAFMMLAFFFAAKVLVERQRWAGDEVEEVRAEAAEAPTGEQAGYETAPEARIRAYSFDGGSFAYDTPISEAASEAQVGQTVLQGSALQEPTLQASESQSGISSSLASFWRHPLLLPSLSFGIALGMAVASKLNAAPVAFLLPVAVLIGLVSAPAEKRWQRAWDAFPYLVLAAVVSLLVFRIFQPYAFSGPGFFGFRLNPRWVAQIQEQRAQSSPAVDFPPAMQWARRPNWFSAQNLILWGLGLPLGLLAFAGMFWAGWRTLVGWGRRPHGGLWQNHLLIFGWTAFYFIWQSLALNPTMRYQLPIYPTLAIFAGWAVIALWDRRVQARGALGSEERAKKRLSWNQVLALLVGGIVLVATSAYAFGFVQIYKHPVTRVAASRWIFENIPGAIALEQQTGQGIAIQSVPFPYSYQVTADIPYFTAFQAKHSGQLDAIQLPHVTVTGLQETAQLTFTISEQSQGNREIARGTIQLKPQAEGTPGDGYIVQLHPAAQLTEGNIYSLGIEMAASEQPTATTIDACGPLVLNLESPSSSLKQSIPRQAQCLIEAGQPLQAPFMAQGDGWLTQISLPGSAGEDVNRLASGIRVDLLAADGGELLGQSRLLPTPSEDAPLTFTLDSPFTMNAGSQYLLSLQSVAGGPSVTLQGAGIANEGEWDDGLPLRMDGYDPFGGIYPLDLNFNMYWDDTPEKLARFERILGEADYLVISSSRQWGSLPRIPERFPMTTLYYRNLLGCPDEKTIEWCYNVAQPGMFQGNLGYDLVKTFQSNPSIGSLQINDQFAEEAFTVYDHPKVFIFRRTAAYNPQRVQKILGAVDFSRVIRVPPMQAPPHPATLMLPTNRWAAQMQGGTWSQIFDVTALQNRYRAISVVLWYLSVFLLGLFTYPLLRALWHGLPDRGYPLARIAGMLLLSYLVWLAGSARIPVTRPTISVIIVLIVAAGLWVAYRQRQELGQELRQRGRYFLIVEGLFLAFFLFDLALRYGNPDLWHPFKGGEKPMDFAYFNAVLKSTSFPPYDPWFAGGYLNYYYYGFVFVGMLVKWLGIVPAVAYNLILPTIFAMIALGAFSLAWNLYALTRRRLNFKLSPSWAGLGGALGMAFLGNLGVVRMIYQGYQRLAAPGGVIQGASLFTRLIWAVQGFFQVFGGASLPYRVDEWYWNPSRAIPAPGEVEPITEFPFFTVLYGDPHAHLFALPIALLALSFALAMLAGRGRWRSPLAGVGAFFLGALAVGALRPTNTWDFYTYLPLAVVAVGYSVGKNFRGLPASLRQRYPGITDLPDSVTRLLLTIGVPLLLVGLSLLLFQPYAEWYGLGYNKIGLWEGTRTPTSSYLVHWGLFLFVIVSWMVWESLDWMRKTPASSLRKLAPFRFIIQASILLLALVVFGLLWSGVHIAWLALPLAAWAGVLLLRPDQPDEKRFVLFLIGTGLVLTLLVEVIVLQGDIARMNTVFKLYLQVWTLFAISAGAALGWLLVALPEWLPSWQVAWRFGLTVLVASTALYPLMGGLGKVKDRMAQNAPHTLDGMQYMEYAVYGETWGPMPLKQDYFAIQWMQQNVQGSPVIVEGNTYNQYRWDSRFSIYTGLPGVVGWQWHEQQQRTLLPHSWVTERIDEVRDFYTTTDLAQAEAFLRKYDVRFIIVGLQERGLYGNPDGSPSPGLEKFAQNDGGPWRAVYQNGDTVIYKVSG